MYVCMYVCRIRDVKKKVQNEREREREREMTYRG